MAIDDPRRWLWLAPARCRRPWAVRVHDEQGGRRELVWPGVAQLAAVIEDATAAGPVPVFFQPVARAPRFNRRVAEALRPFERAGRVQVIRLAHSDFAPRAPFELPFDVAFFDGLDPAVSAPLGEAAWRAGVVAEYGFRVSYWTLDEYRWLPAARDQIDVAVCDAATAHRLLGVGARRSWPPRHPRLIAVVDAPHALRGEPRRPLPRGVAMVLAPCASSEIAGRFIHALARQLTHDLPLHAAVRLAGAALPASAPAPTLIADPYASWSLALSDAYRAVTARAAPMERAFRDRLRRTPLPIGLERVIARGGEVPPPIHQDDAIPRSGDTGSGREAPIGPDDEDLNFDSAPSASERRGRPGGSDARGTAGRDDGPVAAGGVDGPGTASPGTDGEPAPIAPPGDVGPQEPFSPGAGGPPSPITRAGDVGPQEPFSPGAGGSPSPIASPGDGILLPLQLGPRARAEINLRVEASSIARAFQAAVPRFDREAGGLTALATLEARLADYDRAAADPALFAPDRASGDPALFAAERAVPRAVDVALVRTGAAPPGVAIEPRDPTRVLPPTVLGAGRRYELVVQIGGRLLGGLVDAPSPIDPLLPPSPSGHRLEVAALGLELEVESAPVVAIRLPRVGASEVARFVLRAPSEPTAAARVRVLITYRDRVLQSYVMTAAVDATERHADVPPVRPAIAARLEHRASPRFDRLDGLRPRSAAIVLNADPAGSHTLQVKRASQVATCRFTESQIEAITREIRSELTASVGGESSQFPEPPPDGTADRASRARQFARSIRALAKCGAALHREVLLQVGRRGDAVVRELRATRDQTIHIVQASGSFSLPWAVLYDWTAPADYAAFDALPVCDGASIVESPGLDGAVPPIGQGTAPPPSQGTAPPIGQGTAPPIGQGTAPPTGSDAAPQTRGVCGHTAASTGVVCCRGFWGLRHRLEQLLADPDGDEPAALVSGHRTPLRVGLGGSVTLGALFPAFSALCADPAVAIAAGSATSAMLWTDRPAVLIALGALSTSGSGMTAQHQIDLQPALADAEVAQLISTAGRWSDPRSVIMLMACGSAATSLGALLGLTRVLVSAGAGAVIGTETDLFSGAASRFAAALRAHLLAPRPADGGASDADAPVLGTAMQRARWELIAGHSPAGLTFVAYGNADLEIGAAGAPPQGRS